MDMPVNGKHQTCQTGYPYRNRKILTGIEKLIYKFCYTIPLTVIAKRKDTTE